MTMTLLLPWFPILLGAGVGGRLLGRRRGYALGFLCGLFWIVFVSASIGAPVWDHYGTVATLLLGGAAIFVIAGWAGETVNVGESKPNRADPAPTGEQTAPAMHQAAGEPTEPGLAHLVTAVDRFDDWLTNHRDDGNPWPAFDEFIRGMLYDCCQAAHARPYRLLDDGDTLTPLRKPDDLTEMKCLSGRKGIVGHVVTTGRPFVAGDSAQGDLVTRLAAESEESIAWCFAVRQGVRRLGAVTIGRIDLSPERHRTLLRATEALVNQFWILLSETCYSRAATLDDPVSGLFVREAFLRVAEKSLRESYRDGEPVAVLVVALEGLRTLNDQGRWEVADELIQEVSGELRRKTRMDDCVGRFDDSRFIVLLRRVDSQLALLIAAQLMSRLEGICSNEARWKGSLRVRCGVVGSGTSQPELRTLVAGALSQAARARSLDVPIADDLDAPPPATPSENIGAGTAAHSIGTQG